MTDDPREILKAAGEECAELNTFLCGRGPSEWEDDDELDAAFLALARLVVRYKGMLRLACIDDDFPDEVSEGDFEGYVADLDRRWEKAES